MGTDYQKVVTPDSDLHIACRKCGHVTRAFDQKCPQCGSRLGKTGIRWGWILIVGIVGGLLLAAFLASHGG